MTRPFVDHLPSTRKHFFFKYKAHSVVNNYIFDYYYHPSLHWDLQKVVVLSEGRVVEDGHPHLLLESSTAKKVITEGGTSGVVPSRSDETLASMVEETGPANAEIFRQLAQQAWQARKCLQEQE